MAKDMYANIRKKKETLEESWKHILFRRSIRSTVTEINKHKAELRTGAPTDANSENYILIIKLIHLKINKTYF